jgi:hypothetical protein
MNTENLSKLLFNSKTTDYTKKKMFVMGENLEAEIDPDFKILKEKYGIDYFGLTMMGSHYGFNYASSPLWREGYWNTNSFKAGLDANFAALLMRRGRDAIVLFYETLANTAVGELRASIMGGVKNGMMFNYFNIKYHTWCCVAVTFAKNVDLYVFNRNRIRILISELIGLSTKYSHYFVSLTKDGHFDNVEEYKNLIKTNQFDFKSLIGYKNNNTNVKDINFSK